MPNNELFYILLDNVNVTGDTQSALTLTIKELGCKNAECMQLEFFKSEIGKLIELDVFPTLLNA